MRFSTSPERGTLQSGLTVQFMRMPALVFLLSALAYGADKIVGGPYIVNVTPQSATVAWVIQTGEVTLGTTSDKMTKTSPVLRTEKTSFTGLQPATTYYFDTAGLDSAKGSFRTPPLGRGAFQFVVLGDTRTRHDIHRKVVEAVLKYSAPEFVIHTGDLVENGGSSSLWPIFFDIERDLLRKTAFFPSLGNHERNSRQYYDFFDATSSYYSFNWGAAHFAILNSDVSSLSASPATREAMWGEQVRWLEEDLERNQKADFRFVVAHHPPFSAVARRQDGNQQMVALVPMFERLKVTAGFFGHDHNYQHYLKNGIHYFITGGGGAPLYDVAKPPADITQKVVSVENFLVVKVDGTALEIDALGIDGKPIESTAVRPRQ